MDVFEAVNSPIACRRFLDKPVDHHIVRQLIEVQHAQPLTAICSPGTSMP